MARFTSPGWARWLRPRVRAVALAGGIEQGEVLGPARGAGEMQRLERDRDLLGEADADEAAGRDRVAAADQADRLGGADDLAFVHDLARAGSTVPRHSPKPMRRKPSRSQQPRRITAVAVLEEGARLAVGQRDRLLAALRSARAASRPRSGVGPDSVPVPNRSPGCRLQPLTVWCATSCADRPVGVGDSSSALSRSPAWPGLAHRRGLQPDLELDVDRAALRGWPASRGRAAAAGRPPGRANGAAERRQRLHRHDPGRHRAREVLRQERARAAGTPRPGCRAPTSR